jgi:hypothetical protein
MKEQLITFETAKLAKEKGFDLPCHSYYFEDGEFKEFKINGTYGYYGDEYTVSRNEFYTNWNDKWKTTKKGDRCFGCDKEPKYLETFSAPTIAEVVMWLYEKHGIWVQVSMSKYGKLYSNILKKESTKNLQNPIAWEMQVQLNDFNSPTEAYEAAIQYTLNNLI